MGLDSSFLSMLEASVSLERKTGADQWGNDTYAAATTERAFVDTASVRFGGDAGSDRTEAANYAETDLIMDGIGVEPGDRITYDSTPHWVTSVATTKDEDGTELFQTVTVSTTKRG